MLFTLGMYAYIHPQMSHVSSQRNFLRTYLLKSEFTRVLMVLTGILPVVFVMSTQLSVLRHCLGERLLGKGLE